MSENGSIGRSGDRKREVRARHGAPRARAARAAAFSDALEGIVIADARWASESRSAPRISAFIWGGKVRPTPTLAFGRWKGAA